MTAPIAPRARHPSPREPRDRAEPRAPGGHAGVAGLRRRPRRHEGLAAHRHQPGQCRPAHRRLGVAAGRSAARGVRHPTRQLPEHAAHDRQRPLRVHAVQPRGGTRRRDRATEVGVRPESVRRRAAAERDRLRPPRAGRLARPARRQQAADLPELALPLDLPRRGDRYAGRVVRREGHRRSQPEPDLAHREEALHEHLAARRFTRTSSSSATASAIGSSTRTTRRATSARSTRAPASWRGASTRFPNAASSGTRPGRKARRATPDTPTRGRR